MDVPCKDCITIAICRAKVRETRVLHACSLAYEYIDPPDGILRPHKEKLMYRQTRFNKVVKELGLKKRRVKIQWTSPA